MNNNDNTELLNLIGELFIRLMERLGFKQARAFTTLGCLVAGGVLMAVGSALAIGIFFALLALLGWVTQFIR